MVLDLLNRDAVLSAVLGARPDAIVHPGTSLAGMRIPKNFDREFERTKRLRTEGTGHLLDAAREAGAQRFVGQSYADELTAHTGARVRSEADPLDLNRLAKTMKRSSAAIRQLKEMVTAATGVAGTEKGLWKFSAGWVDGRRPSPDSIKTGLDRWNAGNAFSRRGR